MLGLFPLSNKQVFPFLNFQNILFLFKVHNSFTHTVSYTYSNAHVHTYTHTHIYIYNLYACLRVKVPVHEGSVHDPGYKHTSTYIEVQLKAAWLTNFL